ncbi:MAG: hypothetical protein AB7G13_11740 [Lautropia sp.]
MTTRSNPPARQQAATGRRSMHAPDPDEVAAKRPEDLAADIQGGNSVGTGMQQGRRRETPAGPSGKADEIDPGAGGETEPEK